MADSDVEPELDWSSRPTNIVEDSLIAMECLLTTLRALEATLRLQDISEISSTEYCDNFCQALMQYAGSRNSVEHGLPLLEVYCLSINCFAAARPHLTADLDNVALVLKRLALSCFELLLSVPENEIPYEAWVQFHRSVQVAHDALLQYGSTDLQALLQITGEGGAWSNPVLSALLTGQPTNTEDVDAYIALEGEGFMEMRVKHLEKVGEVAKAVVLAKACAECQLISNQTTFRQTYVSLLCLLLPGEEAIMEISRLDCKDVLDITCNLETEGEENTAFILCTTFLTQQLQQQNLYCSWELTLLWSKLQRRIDPSLESLLERCLQLGAIAKTVYHLLFLVRVIRTEAEELGLASSVELCVKALQLPKQEDTEIRISVCKTVACLLPDDLEVLRGCLLTEFLLGLSRLAFRSLEELYLRPDQKYDQENAIIPNSLRCELLLALKAHWHFDPEFWDWKTLKHHCIRLLGLEPEPEQEEEEEEEVVAPEVSVEEDVKEEVEREFVDSERDYLNGTSGSMDGLENDDESERDSKPPSMPDAEGSLEQGSLPKKYKFFCKICKKSVTETRIVFHSKRHEENGVITCPVCLKKFESRKEFIPHTKLHLQMPSRRSWPKKKDKKRIDLDKEMDDLDDLDDLEPGEIALDPSLMLYYQSTHDPDVLEHILEQASSAPRKPVHEDNITFDYINVHFELQNRDIYTCPATHCTKTFKHSKYLGVHLKSGDHVGDENVKHYFEMRDRREKCTYCRRHFMSAYHHRRHRRVHYGDLPYMCMAKGCGARFGTSNELVAHKQSHGYQLSYQCELKGCSLSFCDLGQVYHHEAQHFRDAAYSCSSLECKKFYFSKKEFLRHLATHGISFSEDDFEAQRKAKRKHLASLAEEMASPKKSALEELVNGEHNATSSACSASSSMSNCKESKGTMTSVAVCFDGKQFTCGFERCGLTFAKARDVHKHLRCTHPEHFKSENKERKNVDKEKCVKYKGAKVKTELNSEGKTKHDLEACLPMKMSSQGNVCNSPIQAKLTTPACLDNDPLREILIGLSQLSLTPSNSTNGFCELYYPISGSTSKIPCHQGVDPRSPAESLQKRARPAVGKMVKQTSNTEPSVTDELPSDQHIEADQISPFVLQASTKPYFCELNGCNFRSVTSTTLIRHYMNKHEFTEEKAKEMNILKSLAFKPFKCHLCFKCHREKTFLRVHYLQAHRLSESVVEQMSCWPKKGKSVKPTKQTATPTKPTKQTVSITQPPEPTIPTVSITQPPEPTKPTLSHSQHPEPTKPTVSLSQSSESAKLTVSSQPPEPTKPTVSLVQPPEPTKSTVSLVQPPEPTKPMASHTQPPKPAKPIVSITQPSELQKPADSITQPSKSTKSSLSRTQPNERTKQTVANKQRSQLLTWQSSSWQQKYQKKKIMWRQQNGVQISGGKSKKWSHPSPSAHDPFEEEVSQDRNAEKSKNTVFMCKHKDCGMLFYHHSSLHRHNKKRHLHVMGNPVLSEDPSLQKFRCSYANCNASYLLNSSLVRHTESEHPYQATSSLKRQRKSEHPYQATLCCKYEGCTRVFTQSSSLKKHVVSSHLNYYDSLVLRLQNTHKDTSVTGCQKKLIVTSSMPQKDANKLPVRQSLRRCPKSPEDVKAEETSEEHDDENVDVDQRIEVSTSKKSAFKKRFEAMNFRSHEEALQMCQDRCQREAYPCMVQGCDSVVTSLNSINRHYLNCHKFPQRTIRCNKVPLVFSAEQLEELIQKKTVLSACPDMTRAPNGVLKMEYQAEPENPGGPSVPMSLHSIKGEPLDAHEPPGFQEKPPAERNVLVGADDLLYGEASGHTEEPPSQDSHSQEERRSKPSNGPTLDPSPPASLRFSVDEGFMDNSGKDCGKPTNISAPLPSPQARQPLKRKNELSDHPPIPKDPQPHTTSPRSFDLAAYKPMGFESSFLKFIQDTSSDKKIENPRASYCNTLKPDPPVASTRRRDSYRRSCSVKENSQLGLATNHRGRPRSSPLKPRPRTGEYTSVQNLHVILDKALAGCGDLAIKQLQYLRPVVVLERPSFPTSLIDLFPTRTNDKLLLGSS
ncbi:zinc finger protein Rlf isoform X2 [Esox lucius]|uniref:zinc finger protein Rlf isoform X2 n=1 Tax=Esox lucius TaxID=8010 RepID=UPI001476AB69|nr:zinc finger protein Rlf isoform X2 [Esox lucius]